MGDDNTDDELGFAEALNFLAERVADEEEAFDYDIPNHAPAIIVDDAAELLQTATSIEMAYEMADEDDDIAEERMEEELVEAVVDLLTGVAALKHEEDMDIAGAVEDRIDFIESYREFEEAMEDAETRDEQMEAMDEHLTEEMAARLGMRGVPDQTQIGDNVDRDGYNPDDVDKAFQ